MAASSKSERTEKPTAKKQRDARKKGQIPRTKDLTQAASMAAVVAALVWTGSAGLGRVMAMMADFIDLMGDQPTQIVAGTMVGIVTAGGLTLAYFCAPMALAVSCAVVASQAVQGGWVFAPEAMKPDISRLSPMTGLKRLGASRGWVDMVKTMSIVAAVAYFAVKDVTAILAEGPRLAMMSPLDAALLAWDTARTLIWQTVIIFVIAAMGDYGLQRWRHNTSLKMTKREVKDDHRLAEGSPETKARIRRIQRDMARRRMLADVPNATVVITNPTEYAIALDYQRDLLPAPRVVAKGRNAMARKIREIAREHGVPIVENRSLARALHAAAEIGNLIPADLFDAVAEVLVYLVRLKQLKLKGRVLGITYGHEAD